MPLTFTTRIDGGNRTWKDPGIVMAEVDMTTSTGGGGADYSSGFPIQLNASKLGFRKVFAVVSASAKNGAGTFLPLIWFTWDFITVVSTDPVGRLRVANATSEANAAATLTANSVIRMVVIGV